LIKEMTSAIRRYKAEHGMPLNAPLKEIEIYSTISDASDIAGAANSTIKLKSGAPDFELVPKEIKPNMKVLGKTYRSKAKSIAQALISADLKLAGSGNITLDIEGEEITLDATCFTVEKERLLKGKSVDVLEVGSATIVIMR
jgi:valyl-tRNA synthetase